jgi:hypothetical protein
MIHAANPGRHSIAARKNDLYETPPEAVRALLRVESCRNPFGSRHVAPVALSESYGRTATRFMPPILTTTVVPIPQAVSTS